MTKLQESCPLTFEIGIRTIEGVKKGQKNWQEFVRIKDPEFQNIIEKILWRVDFGLNATNLKGIKEPQVHNTNDHFFRNHKRNCIKNNKIPEIAMEPMPIGTT